MPRPRLLRHLAGGWKVAVLTAPAGYGKTTLAMQWAGRRPVLWCRLGPEDRDPAHLLGSLLAAGERMRPPLPGRARRLFESRRDWERDGGLLTAGFLRELPPARGERVVVLDDLHLLAEARTALQWLRRVIEESGPRVRFLATCRGECPLPLARFELLGGAVTLGAEELAFTVAEQTALLRRRCGLRVSPRGASALLAGAGGWAAGVVLVARHLERTGRAPRAAAPGGDDATRMARALAFIAEEVLAPLPEGLQRSLAGAALLEELDPAALRALLGGRAAGHLQGEVARRDLFAHTPPGAAFPRFHPIFRSALEASGRLGPEERRRALVRLAEHWEARGETARAVRALAGAGETARAVALFDAAAGQRAKAHRGARPQPLGPVALELVGAAGAEERARLSPAVLFHAAQQARDARRHDQALELARASQEGFLRRRAAESAAHAYRLEGQTAIQCGRLRDAAARGEALLARLPGKARAARGLVALQLGYLELFLGEPRRSRAILERGARWLAGAGPAVERAELALARATVEYTEGRWDVYLRDARRVLPVYRRAGYLGRVETTLINMAEACTYRGEEEQALAHFDEARAARAAAGESTPNPHDAIYRARAHSEMGALAEAARGFREAREVLGRYGHPMQALELDVWEGICQRRRGRLAAADVGLTRALEEAVRIGTPSWVALARMERALVRGLAGRTAEALRELATAARATRRLGDRKELARNTLFEARVRQAAGGAYAAPLARALTALVRQDYLVLLRKEADVARPLLDAAVLERITGPWLVRALGALPEPLRRQNAAPPRRLPARRAVPAVHVRLLGGLAVEVEGRPAAFSRRAAAALVACLALRRGAAVRRESLAETLWPDAPPAGSRNRLDVALNAARQALEPGAGARGPFRVLASEGGLCRLVGVAVDVEEFERAARACEPLLERHARARWTRDAAPARAEGRRALARIEEALGRYGGLLLPEWPDAAWAEGERERLRAWRLRLLLGRGTAALALGDAGRALESAQLAVAEDSLDEEGHRLQLRALAARGEQAQALRAHRAFAERLERELDAEPSPETAALARELAGG